MERRPPPVSVPARVSGRLARGFLSSAAVCAGFSSEAELLTHLRSGYDSTLSGSQWGVLAAAQHLLTAVKTFFSAESDALVRRVLAPRPELWFGRNLTRDFSCRSGWAALSSSIFSSPAGASGRCPPQLLVLTVKSESECFLPGRRLCPRLLSDPRLPLQVPASGAAPAAAVQPVLLRAGSGPDLRGGRLPVWIFPCSPLGSDAFASLRSCDAPQVADLLRIISLTKDPVCLTRFLQDDVLPG